MDQHEEAVFLNEEEESSERLGDQFFANQTFNIGTIFEKSKNILSRSNITNAPTSIPTKKSDQEPFTPRKWGTIEKSELTEEQKRDLKVIALMGHVDRNVSKNRVTWDLNSLPTNVHFGQIEDTAYNRFSRMTKKERGQTILDEALVNDKSLRAKARERVELINQTRNDGYLAFKARRKNKPASKKKK